MIYGCKWFPYCNEVTISIHMGLRLCRSRYFEVCLFYFISFWFVRLRFTCLRCDHSIETFITFFVAVAAFFVISEPPMI